MALLPFKRQWKCGFAAVAEEMHQLKCAGCTDATKKENSKWNN
jgi:hypothetical protein